MRQAVVRVLVLLPALLVFPALLGNAATSPTCKPFYIDDTSDDYFWAGNGARVSWEFDPSKDDASTGALVQVSTCALEDANTCKIWEYDSDDDGARDTSYIDGVTDGMRASPASGVFAPGYWYFDAITAPTAPDIAVLKVCRY